MSDVRARAQSLLKGLSRQRRLAHDYRHVFTSPEGERVLLDLMRRGGVLSVAHVEADSHSTAYNDGKRALGFEILRLLRWSEAQLLELAKEQQDSDFREMTEDM